MPPQKGFSGYLLYCIYIQNSQGPVAGLTGIQAQPVEIISVKGLCAAVSALTGAIPANETTVLKRYGQVVAACHQAHATIPMQYGSIFMDKPGIAAHLEERNETYKALLLHLTDCDEMGIRLLLPEPPTASNTNLEHQDQSHAAQKRHCSGQAYLMHQKARYGLADDSLQRAKKALSQWQAFFRELYMDCVWEQPHTVASNKTFILSVYFLVPRRHIPDFINTFARVSQQRPEKALLSGPWPPFNFVRPKQTPSLPLSEIPEFNERDRT